MTRKRLFIGGFIILGIIALLLLPSLFTLDRYKPYIAETLSSMLGQEVTIHGHIRFTLFPDAIVSVKEVTIAAPEGFTKPNVLELASAKLHVKLWSLLHKQVRIDEVTLEKPVLYLEKNAKGKKNWPELPKTEDVPSDVVPIEAAGPSNIALPILKALHIKDGKFTWRDGKERKETTFDKIDIKASLNEAHRLEVAFDAETKDKPLHMKAQVEDAEALIKEGKTDVAVSVKNGKEAYELKGATSWKARESAWSDLVLTTPFGVWKGNLRAAFPAKDIPSVFGQFETDGWKIPVAEKKPDTVKDLPQGASATPPWSAERIATPSLPQANVDLSINAAKGEWGKVVLGPNSWRVVLKEGILQLQATDVSIYQGHVAGTMTMQPRAEEMLLVTRGSLKGIQLGNACKQLFNEERVQGIADAGWQLETRGNSVKALVGKLQGQMSLYAKQGTVKGLNLSALSPSLTALLSGFQSSPKGSAIESVKGNFSVNQGIVINRDLVLQSPVVTLGGEGSVDLPKYRWDYRIRPQSIPGKKNYFQTAVISITGPLNKPDVSVDLGRILQDNYEGLKSLKDKIKEDGKGITKGLQKGLRNLVPKF